MSHPTEKNSGYDKNIPLLKAYRAGDREAGEELVLLNRPLVYHIVGKFAGRYRDIEELVDTGNVGLVKAMNTFDFSRECAFSTYAVPLIFGEIRRFLRDDGLIKVSREEKRLSAILNAERERRMNTGESTAIDDIAAAVGVSREDAAGAIFASGPVRSLDEHAYDDDDPTTLGGTVFDEDAPRRDFDRLALRMALEKLPEKQKQLILLRYFRDFSQSRTAAALGLTQVKVSREEKKILEILRRDLV